MSEKRFTFDEFVSAYDGRVVSYSIKDNGERMMVEKVVDLLNFLVEENESLKQRIRDMNRNGCGFDD